MSERKKRQAVDLSPEKAEEIKRLKSMIADIKDEGSYKQLYRLIRTKSVVIHKSDLNDEAKKTALVQFMQEMITKFNQ